MPGRLSIADRINALSYSSLFTIWGGTVVAYAIIYFLLSYIPGNGPSGIDGSAFSRVGNSMYYSVITATNTGYGDIVPVGISRFFAALQSVSELFLFALFVSKLVTRRQDMALNEIHKLSFELTFHNIREDLFIARKDFDHIVNTVHTHGAMSGNDWERLTVAYQHITSLLQEIPNFYNVTSDLYIIDPRREMLLIEAVQRTLSRITHVLDTLNRSNISWKEEPESLEELKTLSATLDTIIPLWQHHSHDTHIAFGSIIQAQHTLKNALA